MSNEQSQKNKDIELRLYSGFGERLRIIRGENSREAFAQRLGISSSALNNYESEKRIPDLVFAKKIYVLEGVMPNWLVLGYGKPYAKDGDRDDLIPPLYNERIIVDKIIAEEHASINIKQRDAIVEIIKEEIRKKVQGIVSALKN